MVHDVQVRIVNRVNAAGHPFSEVLYTYSDDHGYECHALTRYWHPLIDSPHSRQSEVQQFKVRAARYGY